MDEPHIGDWTPVLAATAAIDFAHSQCHRHVPLKSVKWERTNRFKLHMKWVSSSSRCREFQFLLLATEIVSHQFNSPRIANGRERERENCVENMYKSSECCRRASSIWVWNGKSIVHIDANQFGWIGTEIGNYWKPLAISMCCILILTHPNLRL